MQKLSDDFFTKTMHGFVYDIQKELKNFESFKTKELP